MTRELLKTTKETTFSTEGLGEGAEEEVQEELVDFLGDEQKAMEIKFLLVLLFLVSCGTINPFMQSYEELDRKKLGIICNDYYIIINDGSRFLWCY